MISKILPISSRVTTQKRISSSLPLRPPRPLKTVTPRSRRQLIASRISSLLSDTIVIAVYSSMPWSRKSSVLDAETYVRME